MSEPTREQKCADLARAMGWTQGKVSGVWFSPPDSPELCVYNVPPNPYESAEDSRALVLWLAKQREADRFNDELARVIGPTPLQALLAPLPVIADAAWRALTYS